MKSFIRGVDAYVPVADSGQTLGRLRQLGTGKREGIDPAAHFQNSANAPPEYNCFISFIVYSFVTDVLQLPRESVSVLLPPNGYLLPFHQPSCECIHDVCWRGGAVL